MSADSTILRDIGFKQLSQGVFLYSPLQQGTPTEKYNPTHSNPDIIIICAWGFAQARHIAKYIDGYQSLYPTAKILLIYNCVANMMWKSDASQMQWFQPAATILREYMDSTPDLKVLLHLFSNTGSHSAVQLSEACEKNHPPFALPVTSIIFDSCPSMPVFAPMANALALGSPSKNILITFMAKAVACSIIGVTLALEKAGLVTHVATKLYARLNSINDVFLTRRAATAEQIALRPIPRAYVYGPSDDMIPVCQVIKHADIAIENMLACGVDDASKYVTKEEFVGSPHVNHVRFEKGRYWGIIKETWKKTVNV